MALVPYHPGLLDFDFTQLSDDLLLSIFGLMPIDVLIDSIRLISARFRILVDIHMFSRFQNLRLVRDSDVFQYDSNVWTGSSPLEPHLRSEYQGWSADRIESGGYSMKYFRGTTYVSYGDSMEYRANLMNLRRPGSEPIKPRELLDLPHFPMPYPAELKLTNILKNHGNCLLQLELYLPEFIYFMIFGNDRKPIGDDISSEFENFGMLHEMTLLERSVSTEFTKFQQTNYGASPSENVPFIVPKFSLTRLKKLILICNDDSHFDAAELPLPDTRPHRRRISHLFDEDFNARRDGYYPLDYPPGFRECQDQFTSVGNQRQLPVKMLGVYLEKILANTFPALVSFDLLTDAAYWETYLPELWDRKELTYSDMLWQSDLHGLLRRFSKVFPDLQFNFCYDHEPLSSIRFRKEMWRANYHQRYETPTIGQMTTILEYIQMSMRKPINIFEIRDQKPDPTSSANNQQLCDWRSTFQRYEIDLNRDAKSEHQARAKREVERYVLYHWYPIIIMSIF